MDFRRREVLSILDEIGVRLRNLPACVPVQSGLFAPPKPSVAKACPISVSCTGAAAKRFSQMRGAAKAARLVAPDIESRVIPRILKPCLTSGALRKTL